MKVIRVDGIKGIVSMAFMGICLFAGFVIFPGYVAMTLWNKYLTVSYMFPSLSLFQGILLWGIVILSYYILTGGGFAVSFKNTPELSDEELSSIIKTAKISSQMRIMNKIISKSDKFDSAPNKNPFDSEDVDLNTSQEDETSDKVSNLK